MFQNYFSIPQLLSSKNKIAQNLMVESQYSVSDSLEQSSVKSIYSEQIPEIPKIKLNWLVFLLNVTWMLLCCHANLYYVFAPRIQGDNKGKLAGIALGLTLSISLPTFFYLTTLKNLLKLTFLIDTIMTLTIAAGVAFVNLILMFDKGGTWYYPVMEVGFSVQIIFYSTMTRVLLVNLDWSKWQLVFFKLHLMVNCLMFLISGIYFIWIDFTYTNGLLPSFDNKVHEFMVLFIFTMFAYTYELYSKVTDLDHTGDLRFSYKMKNVDESRPKKTKCIIKQKRQSINSVRLLTQAQQMKQVAKQYMISRFANVQVES